MINKSRNWSRRGRVARGNRDTVYFMSYNYITDPISVISFSYLLKGTMMGGGSRS